VGFLDFMDEVLEKHNRLTGFELTNELRKNSLILYFNSTRTFEDMVKFINGENGYIGITSEPRIMAFLGILRESPLSDKEITLYLEQMIFRSDKFIDKYFSREVLRAIEKINCSSRSRRIDEDYGWDYSGDISGADYTPSFDSEQEIADYDLEGNPVFKDEI